MPLHGLEQTQKCPVTFPDHLTQPPDPTTLPLTPQVVQVACKAAFLNCGQNCAGGERFFVHEKVGSLWPLPSLCGCIQAACVHAHSWVANAVSCCHVTPTCIPANICTVLCLTCSTPGTLQVYDKFVGKVVEVVGKMRQGPALGSSPVDCGAMCMPGACMHACIQSPVATVHARCVCFRACTEEG